MNARQLKEVLDYAGSDAPVRFSTVVNGIPRDLKPRESQITRRRKPEERGELTPYPLFENSVTIYLDLQ